MSSIYFIQAETGGPIKIGFSSDRRGDTKRGDPISMIDDATLAYLARAYGYNPADPIHGAPDEI